MEIWAKQPNTYVFSRNNLTELQFDLMTLAFVQLQKHLRVDDPLPVSEDGLHVDVDCADFGMELHKKYIAEQCLKLPIVYFEKPNPFRGRLDKYYGNLFDLVAEVENTTKVRVFFSSWVLPYLTYIGKGSGFTLLPTKELLGCDGLYVKKFVTWIYSWRALPGGMMRMTVSDFLKNLNAPANMSIGDIARRILEPARTYFGRANHSIQFEYDYMYKDGEAPKRGRKKVHALVFSILSDESPVTKGNNNFDALNRTYLVLRRLFCNEKSVDIDLIVSDIMSKGGLVKFLKKFDYYSSQVRDGEKDTEDLINIMRHIIFTDFGACL